MRNREPAVMREGEEEIIFGPFRLTRAPLRLWRGRREVKLQPRPLAVLGYLVEHADAVVSREELLHAVWKGTVVTPAALQVCVRAIRAALGDAVETPRYLATVGREGYQFIGQVVSSQYSVDSRKTTESRSQESEARIPSFPSQHSTLNTQHSVLVGRDAELEQIYTLLGKALRGERQLVFITGEAGIGKTTLVDTFLQGLGSRVQRQASERQGLASTIQTLDARRQTLDASPWIGRGQCLEHSAEGEAYLPVLEAIGQLCQGPDGADFLAALRRYAPTWLLHLPGIVTPEEREALQRQGAGATQGQMLREMAEALEAVSTERGLVLIFEDLHVSDRSTVELLAYLAQRRVRARLLIIGTYRPVEVVVSDHPLRGRVHELLARGYSQRLALELLTEVEVEAYLRQRLDTIALPATLASQIWQRTDGNPLFVVNIVEYLLQQERLIAESGQWRLEGDLASSGVPETLEHLIAKQLDSLSMNQHQVLEVASVAGTTFTTASVASGMQTTVEAVDEVCERLARQGQFIAERGLAEWPDGTVSGQYGFRHILYQDVLYQRLGAGRRARVHLAIGTREETGYGAQASEHAAELARHFVQGRNMPRAVPYLLQAGQNALRLSAHVEALSHFTQGLTLLAAQPETPERVQQELWLQIGLGVAQMATKGFAVPEVERAFLRAHTLCQQIGDTPELFHVLVGLWAFYLTRGELPTARPLAERLLRLAHDTDDPALLAVAHGNMQLTLYSQGELASARVHGEQALTLFAASPSLPLVFSYGPDPAVRAQNSAAAVLHALGYLDQAWQESHAALATAKELGHAQTVAGALQVVASLHGACRKWGEMQACAAELMALSISHDLPFWWAVGACNHGIALAQQGNATEGINQIRQGLAVYRAAGTTIGIPRILGWLAEVCACAGQIDEGVQVLAEAFAVIEQGGERIWEAELYRRKGELLLKKSEARSQKLESTPQHPPPSTQAEAEGYFLKAIAIARQQQAKLWELRAAMSLSRLWQQQGKQAKARELLAETYGWFTEGFDTSDLREAKALLDELSA
jgi:DNA-binding winged helix-turn-helix (wHTH) protein/predicted ATPase